MRTLFGTQAVRISRAADAAASLVQNVSTNHRRPNVTVTKEFLHRADVIARLDQMGCERVTECMSCHTFRDRRSTGRCGNCLRYSGFVQVMTPPHYSATFSWCHFHSSISSAVAKRSACRYRACCQETQTGDRSRPQGYVDRRVTPQMLYVASNVSAGFMSKVRTSSASVSTCDIGGHTRND